MHELSICRAVLRLVEDIARPHAAIVRKVEVRVGPLSGVEPKLLARAWPIAAAGTVADASVLEIETADVVVRCRGCGVSTPASVNDLVCGACGDWHTDLVGGDELMLLHVELATPAAANVE
jgi:hydrogenase nickel incorporation protein HypA/HybF